MEIIPCYYMTFTAGKWFFSTNVASKTCGGGEDGLQGNSFFLTDTYDGMALWYELCFLLSGPGHQDPLAVSGRSFLHGKPQYDEDVGG